MAKPGTLKKRSKPSVATNSNGAPLHVKLRPKSFDEVVGQEAAVKSLQGLLKSSRVPHAFLFTGPSGCGKTTLARILASDLRADPKNIIELDAATNSGVGEMRNLTGMLIYQGLGESNIKFVIVDECHALSKQTWQSLLVSIEEPPEHVYWVLCTTEADKVPQTIKTRCHAYELKPVPKALLGEYLEYVRDKEGLEVSDEVVQLISEKAEGSVRQALVYLSATEGCDSRKEAYDLLQQAEEVPEVIDLVRRLVDGRGLSWKEVTGIVSAQLEAGQNPESIRIVMVNYVSAVLMKTSDEKRVVRLLTLLDAFAEPYRSAEKSAPLLLSIGRIFFEE